MASLIITVPVKGWAAELNEVPHPVFADRVIGDGVAIHPTGRRVHAPCDGEVIAAHPAGHAITIRNGAGAELLIHVGLNTVGAGSAGVRPLVTVGASVACGDPLIEFGSDAVDQSSASLIIPIIVTNSDAFRIVKRTTNTHVDLGEALMTLEAIQTQPRASSGASHVAVQQVVIIPLVYGIHARPAARISECARQFEAESFILQGDRRVDLRSTVSVMALALQYREAIIVEARGADAKAAVCAITELIEGGMGESAAAIASAAAAQPRVPVVPRSRNVAPPPAPGGVVPPAPAGVLTGITAAPGLAFGKAGWLVDEAPEIARDGIGSAAELVAFNAALASVRDHLDDAASKGSTQQRQILTAHRSFLEDPELLAAAHHHIDAGRSAAFAWSGAIAAQTALLRAAADPRFAERADDLEDVERQMLRALMGHALTVQTFAPDTILLAQDLLPSQVIALDPARIVGIVLARGGATSHVAILAASMGLPMLVASGTTLSTVAAGTPLVLDASAGLLHVDPDDALLHDEQARAAAQRAQRAAALADARAPSTTADGKSIAMFANLGSVNDAIRAVSSGAEGSGLLRTEFLFMDRATAPGEEEQRASYQAIADAMEGRPIVIRLLDIGGDKPVPWLLIAPEKNPMLGQRGIRATLANPELLETQLRAIMAVKPVGQCRIMVPMVSDLAELRAVRTAIERIGGGAVQLGVMIETPAAAAMADLLAREADFLSIGTNDLTQYTLAMDRGNSAVAAGIDGLHPAVLRLIGQSCVGGAAHGRSVGVCGGLASDPAGIALLIGLGVTELSTTPNFLPEAKALVRRLDVSACQKLVKQAMALGSAAEIRALAHDFLRAQG